ncbi:MAG: C39 family peptidase, partial [Candidatus Norongarragalinales archaeon]
STVYGWGNGGYSTDPNNPKYGTHDWIAEHALDWLPQAEKQFIRDNLAAYLYGTELPDNGAAPDGIGDATKHHVYYFANGSLQDDASAVRAQEEYNAAVNFYNAGNYLEAAKRLGMMTHYVADMAVFGHVMGYGTDWGAETHHSDYENYVGARTDNYTDNFFPLEFDGSLDAISAYDAALSLAYDTTFDADGGGLTCLWMDQNYNWSNMVFKNRCGESLNLAVNFIADVLHTFTLDVQDHDIHVPFHYQEKEYYCGPACLEMVFDYYGEDISQAEIADVARTIGEPIYSTFTDELLRAAHFSNISTSMGDELPHVNITGYTMRSLGYAAFESHGMSLDDLKNFVDNGKPLILLMWYSGFHVSGHYRVLTGYNETHIFLHDPWNKPEWGGAYGGPDTTFSYTEFLDLWTYHDYWALYVEPWRVNVSAPAYIKPETPFQINVTVTYPEPPPNALSLYPASACNATIVLPSGVSLAQGEVQKKSVGSGFLEAGMSFTVSWVLVADSSVWDIITVEAEGLVSGHVLGRYNYTEYDYTDRIGAKASFVMEFSEDNTPPLVGVPSREPEGEVQPFQEVKVSVNVTDTESGVKNVTLFYTIDYGATWENKTMNLNSSTKFYEAILPGQEAGATVKFKIVAYDMAGNNATLDGEQPYCIYQVVPEFPPNAILPFLLVLSIFVLILKVKGGLKQWHLTHFLWSEVFLHFAPASRLDVY